MSAIALVIALAAAASAGPVPASAPLLARADTDAQAGASPKVGWVPPPNQRSTIDIAWTCLSVFIICSWRCLHLNLPTPAESRGQCLRFRFLGCRIPYWPDRHLSRKWLRKLTWLAATCFAPEYSVMVALDDRLAARSALRRLRKRLPAKEADKYTMAHAFCAQMGGIAIRKSEPAAKPDDGAKPADKPDDSSDKVASAEDPKQDKDQGAAMGENEDLDYVVCTLGETPLGARVPSMRY